MTNWEVTSLADCVDMQLGFPFKSSQYVSDGIRLLRGDNISQGLLDWDGVKYWTDKNGYAEYCLEPNDVVVAMDRPWIEAGLKYAWIQEKDLPCLLVQRVARLKGGDGLLDGRFLRYVIGSREFTYHVLAVQTGTAVPHISGRQIGEFEFLKPPVDEQIAIAEILSSIDEKIELNRKQNRTLEAIAQALFKRWFVEFEFPDENGQPYKSSGGAMQPSELGEVPVGWEVKPLDQIAEYLNGLALQKFPPEGDEYLPVIKIRELKQGVTANSDKASTRLDPKYIVDDGDVLFSWSGSLAVDIWCHGKGALNQHLFKVTSTNYPKWFYYLWTKYHLRAFQAVAADKATTMGYIQRAHLSEALGRIFLRH